MPVPPEFNHVEHLQSVYRRWLNREVREWFRSADGDEQDDDITTPRGSLLVACTHLDSDSLIMTQMRQQLFDRIRLQKFQIPVVGIPTGSVEESRRYRPQIMLYFQEDQADVYSEYAPVTGEISVRLMNHTSETITPAIANQMANRIQVNFGTGGGYIWRKGKHMMSYIDRNKGYQLQLLVRNEGDGRQLIDRVLDLQTDTPNWSKAQYKENLEPVEAYPTLPDRERVYGEVRRLPRKRPIADVRFQFAVLHVWGLTNPVPLVDRTGLWPSALAS
ncbi:hypothetical protein [Pseudanabaena sp. FACHB-2040]|uniref:hypothetical protein n=1 Tax=Pseudanabaena sp. FACHB-2040 TaxID=2692859 RepID=UPI001682D1FD|nr:hypothetical protein [Pseudanabaena sp. FACHB-2040]MBD2259910.1 hypothetical protein [Pseudanabaena sp. FACHB-2040]